MQISKVYWHTYSINMESTLEKDIKDIIYIGKFISSYTKEDKDVLSNLNSLKFMAETLLVKIKKVQTNSYSND